MSYLTSTCEYRLPEVKVKPSGVVSVSHGSDNKRSTTGILHISSQFIPPTLTEPLGTVIKIVSGTLAGLLVPVVHLNALVATLVAHALNCPPTGIRSSPKIKGASVYGLGSPERVIDLQPKF